MYGNTVNMVETRFEPESYEFEFMPLVTSCGSHFQDGPALIHVYIYTCVGHFHCWCDQENTAEVVLWHLQI